MEVLCCGVPSVHYGSPVILGVWVSARGLVPALSSTGTSLSRSSALCHASLMFHRGRGGGMLTRAKGVSVSMLLPSPSSVGCPRSVLPDATLLFSVFDENRDRARSARRRSLNRRLLWLSDSRRPSPSEARAWKRGRGSRSSPPQQWQFGSPSLAEGRLGPSAQPLRDQSRREGTRSTSRSVGLVCEQRGCWPSAQCIIRVPNLFPRRSPLRSPPGRGSADLDFPSRLSLQR